MFFKPLCSKFPLSFDLSLKLVGSWSYPDLFFPLENAYKLSEYFRNHLRAEEKSTIFKTKSIRGSNSYSYDKGMIDCSVDIENMDDAEKRIIMSFLNSKLANEIKLHMQEKLHSNNVCIDLRYYSYTNVTSPRCLHFDSLRYCIKVFILLDPVLSIETGPYCVVPFSHFSNRLIFLFNKIRRRLRLKNYSLTDAPLFSFLNNKKFFGLPGSLYVSRQDMVHGDIPCQLRSSKSSIKKSALVFYFY